MTAEENISIRPTGNHRDFEVCALMMSATDPWITLNMDYEQCLKAFPGECKEIFVIEVRKVIAGFVIIQTSGTFSGYIQTICIDKSFRGKGLGKKLLTFCEDRILKFSPNVFICVSSFNTGAMKLYLDFGFKLVGELENFVKDGFTELLLRKTVGPRVGYRSQNSSVRLILLLIILSFHYTLFSQGIAGKNAKVILVSSIDSILKSQVNLDKIPGAVIEIKNETGVIYRKAYGYAQKYDYDHQLHNPPEKMTIDHLFDIASLTKVVGTTTSIMLLVDRGLLKIDDPVYKYVKAFGTPDKKEITIRHLLTHTAGLYEWYPLYYRAYNKEQSYKLIGELPLMFPVGEQRRYSDLGFVILGEIIEVISGLSLEKFIQQNIFIPLKMKNTTYNPLSTGNFKKIAATSHGNPYEKRMVYDSTLGFKIKEIDPDQWTGWRNYTLKGEVNDGNAWYANGGISGAAGLFSTVDDLQKLVDMLMNNGRAGALQFISENTIRTFLTKDKFNNGLGWMMDPDNSFMKNAPAGSFGHTGFTGTSISVIPKYNLSVILLINRQNTGLLNNGDYYNLNPARLQIFNVVMKYAGSISLKVAESQK